MNIHPSAREILQIRNTSPQDILQYQILSEIHKCIYQPYISVEIGELLYNVSNLVQTLLEKEFYSKVYISRYFNKNQPRTNNNSPISTCVYYSPIYVPIYSIAVSVSFHDLPNDCEKPYEMSAEASGARA